MRSSRLLWVIAAVILIGAGLFTVVWGMGGFHSQEEVPVPVSENSNTHHVEYDFSGQNEQGKSDLLTHYENKSDHVIGRMYIPDTSMETPLVDSDYFFRRNLEGAYDVSGIPFTDTPENFMSANKNCVIYGHRLTSGEDFGVLKDYLNQDFYNEHPQIYIETDDGISTWDIISVFTINVAEDSFSYTFYTDMADNSQRGVFLNEIRERNQIQTKDYTFQNGDEIITLSTCHYETDMDNGRLALVAVKSRK